jgi:hypothetical protein
MSTVCADETQDLSMHVSVNSLGDNTNQDLSEYINYNYTACIVHGGEDNRLFLMLF